MLRKTLLLLAVLTLAAVLLPYARSRWFGGFDCERIALAETRMWKAYYTHDRQMLGEEMVVLLRRQFGLSLAEAIAVGRDLAGAAVAFQPLRGDYEQILPRLEQAYGRLRQATGGTWNAAAAARAELDWWVARRTPGRDGVKEVGAAIARLYTVLYGRTNAGIEKAGLLRAQAAALRDEGGERCDWDRVERLLKESYRLLYQGIE